MEGLVGSSGFRGVALREITPGLCLAMGNAISSINPGCYALGHDVRFSSPLLTLALAVGLNSGGSDVMHMGLAPTPALAFYSRGKTGGAMVTASHNPPEYNGVKLFDQRGASIGLRGYMKIAALLPRAEACMQGPLGSIRQGNGLSEYIEAVAAAGRLKKGWKVGLDPGDGATTPTAAMIYRGMGLKIQAINVAPDGSFPGRGPEPAEGVLEGLSDLVRTKGLDVGFAYDGDGDRLAIVDEKGKCVDQDAALAFFLARSIGDRRGSVVVNVDTSAVVDYAVEAVGGRVIRSKVGDPHVLEAMVKQRAVAGGEACGAWLSPEHGLCPDGVLSSILFLNFLEEGGMMPSEARAGLPALVLRRRKIPCRSGEKASLMEKLETEIRDRHRGAETLSVDGIRVSFSDRSWVLVRPSGTEPALRITAESESERKTLKLMDEFTGLIGALGKGNK